MAVTDNAITLATFLKMEAPGGDVRLCNGGFIYFDGERYDAEDAVFGTVADWGDIENGFDDLAEDATLTLNPNPDATLASWYRSDLADVRVRVWIGEVDADGKTVPSADPSGDYIVDTIGIQKGLGTVSLELGLVSRAEKLFLINEGNVCSTRFHQKQYPGELGFDNCTGVTGYRAWGVETPATGTSSGGGGSGGNNVDVPNRNVVPF